MLVLPLGRRHRGPGDALDAEIADILGRPLSDPALQAILAGAYLPSGEDDPVAKLTIAYDQLAAAAPLQKKLHKALKEHGVDPKPGQSPIDAAREAGVLEATEAETLHAAERAAGR